MTSTLRTLLLAIAAFVFALFGRASGGGGDGGVWILPSSRSVCGLPLAGAQTLVPPRDWRALSAPKSDLVMQLPPEMGVAAAQLFDRQTGAPLPIAVVGKTLTIPLRTMQFVLAQQGASFVHGLVCDASGRGFVVVIRRVSATDLRVEIY